MMAHEFHITKVCNIDYTFNTVSYVLLNLSILPSKSAAYVTQHGVQFMKNKELLSNKFHLNNLSRDKFHFIFMDNYIAPLQGICSEALPTPARRKRTVLRLERNTDGIDLGRRRSSRGSPFQVEGPRTEKTRFCLMEVVKP